MPDSTSTGKSRPPKSPPARTPNLAGTRGPDPDAPLADVFLTVGVLIGSHGLDGELRMKLVTDDPGQLDDLETVYLGERHLPYAIETVRFHKGIALIRLAGVPDVATADAMRGLTVRIAGADARPLEEGEFYLYQVIGIEARDERGETIGTVTDVLETGANMVLIVTPPDGGKDELFPSIPDVVIDLNPAAGYVILRPQTYWDSE